MSDPHTAHKYQCQTNMAKEKGSKQNKARRKQFTAAKTSRSKSRIKPEIIRWPKDVNRPK